LIFPAASVFVASRFSCVPVPVVVVKASPVEGCFDTGVINAARASSGVGILGTSLDCDDSCAMPRLIWPVFGAKLGLVGVVTPSSAETNAVIDDKARVAVRAAPATSKHLFFMESLHRLCTNNYRKVI
jgi:hypothetical protein